MLDATVFSRFNQIAAIAYELHEQTRRVYRCEADEFA